MITTNFSLALLIAAQAALVPLGPESSATPAHTGDLCPAWSDAGLYYSGSNRTWLQPMSPRPDGTLALGSTRQYAGAGGGIIEDDVVARGELASWSWRYQPNNGMRVYARAADLSLPAFDVFPEHVDTDWQPDLNDGLVGATMGWGECAVLAAVGPGGREGDVVVLSSPDGNSHNWTTVCRNRVGIWTAFRRHAGAGGPNLWGRRVDPDTMAPVGQPFPWLEPWEDPGDQTWPILRAGSRGGLLLAWQETDPAGGWRVRAASYDARGRRTGSASLGGGQDPTLEHVGRNRWVLAWRVRGQGPGLGGEARWAILGPRAELLASGCLSTLPLGDRPGTKTDRPSLRLRDGGPGAGPVLDAAWTRQVGAGASGWDVQVRSFGVVVP